MPYNRGINLEVSVLWLDDCLGIAIDQCTLSSRTALTTYYFWPRNDAWEQIKIELDSKIWVKESEKVRILNQVTKILNLWQNSLERKNIEYVTNHFKELKFTGFV